MNEHLDNHPHKGDTYSSSPLLSRFSVPVCRWFEKTFDAPSPIQIDAWDSIEQQVNTLVIAPTGSGKTLSAFLIALDELIREKVEAAKSNQAQRLGVKVIYVSPLKALGADIERNLRAPLAGIEQCAHEAGLPFEPVRVGIRTGDTTPGERRSLISKPPDILITTPESLYLMLTSKARETLRTTTTVIVDEIHALASTKRGAHLSLSLERLDDLLERPAQRIGLSATVWPHERAAEFLGGIHPVQVVAQSAKLPFEMAITVPVRDMTAIPALSLTGSRSMQGAIRGFGPRRAPIEQAWKSDRALAAALRKDGIVAPDARTETTSIWPHIEQAILQEVLSQTSTIVFVNSRGLCERLTARLNERYATLLEANKASKSSSGCDSKEDQSPEVCKAAKASTKLTTPFVSVRSDIGSVSELVASSEHVIAKAHHGSISKEKRRLVEQELKQGVIPCVVATSSLELGIDMGAVDLVIQVAAPLNVASGLQRIGRANHQFGGVSVGKIFPRTRADILDAAVIAEGMRAGTLDELTLVENALDVLSQQTVAAVAVDEISVDAWFETVVRSACYRNLTRRAFENVLGMLSGAYSYRDLADISARIIWDKSTQMLKARPTTQQLAVGSAGTIPDRGTFSVVLPEGDGKQGRRRVGELDEEMVHESRVGDVIALGTTTWQITEIAADRVMVKPAPGKMARLPFWHGEALARTYAAGCARGAFLRELSAELRGVQDAEDTQGVQDTQDAQDAQEHKAPSFSPAAQTRLSRAGLDEYAQDNLAHYLGMQKAATHVIPTDKQLVVEQCEDEAGQWRIILHTPFGRRVHEPWALAVAQRVMATEGFDAQVGANDDGIILRYPLTETTIPGIELFLFDPDELVEIVTHLIETTALFAARFRECAARALILRTKGYGKRMPLWQQRHAAGQLLEVARTLPDFPITLEAARECLVDVFDLAALSDVMRKLASHTIHISSIQTQVPSPFAANLLFGYVGDHLYDTDMPHAERAASLLSVDPELLKELLGTQDIASLVDLSAEHVIEQQLQRLDAYRVPSGEESVFDLLVHLGYASQSELALRIEGSPDQLAGYLAYLEQQQRVVSFIFGEHIFWASVQAAQYLSDVASIKINNPDMIERVREKAHHESAQNSATSSIDELAYVFARTHASFSVEAFASWAFVGIGFAKDALARLAATGSLLEGKFGTDVHGAEKTYISAQVFKRVRSATQAQIQAHIRPVDSDVYLRFLFDLQGRGNEGAPYLQGIEGVAEVIAQFEGLAFPAALWERTIFPTRVRNYKPAYLEELLNQGEVVWKAQGLGSDMLVSLYPADSPFAPLAFDQVGGSHITLSFDEAHFEGESAYSLQSVAQCLVKRGPCSASQLLHMLENNPDVLIDEQTALKALRVLASQGRATSTSAAFIRQASQTLEASATKSDTKHVRSHNRVRSRRSTSHYRSELYAAKQTARRSVIERTKALSAYEGIWSLTVPSQEDSTSQAIGLVEALLDAYGVITRDIALLAGCKGGLTYLYPVLRQMEEQGMIVRGMFVENLGPVQFATTETINTLRSYVSASDLKKDDMFVLSADDPACLYGAGLAWPVAEGIKPSRKSGSVVVMCAGTPVLFASAGLKNLVTFTDDTSVLLRAFKALAACPEALLQAESASERARKKLVVQTCNGQSVFESGFDLLLAQAGFVRLPDGMRLYTSPF